MSKRLKTGDRVRYLCNGRVNAVLSLGTVVAVGEPSPNLPVRGINYTVQWDDVDYSKGYTPTIYKAGDLAIAE